MANDRLDFSTNWNTKLRCLFFTTLRLRNDKKYYKGATFQTSFQNYPKGKVKVYDIRFITIDKINDWIARLDTGYSANECRKILKEMYKHRPINWKTQELAYMLLGWEGEMGMNSLFDKEIKE